MIKSSGVKNTFYILISILILFWLVTSLVFLDRWNRQSHYSSIRDEISDLKYNFSHYCDLNKLSQITTSSFHPASGEKMEEIDRLNSEMVASLDLIETDYIFSRNTPVVRKIRTFRENLTEINLLVNEYTALIKQAGSMTSGTLARTRDILEVLKEIPGVDFFKKYYPDFIHFIVNPDPEILEGITDAWIILKEQVMKDLPNSVMTKQGPVSNEELKLYSEEFFSGITQLITIMHKTGSPGKGGIQGDIYINRLRMENILEELKRDVESSQAQFVKRMKNRLLTWLILSGSIVIFILFSISSYIHKHIYEIKEYTKTLNKGELTENIIPNGKDELGRIKENLYKLVQSLRDKAEFANQMAKGNFTTGFTTLGKSDILGNSLMELSGKISMTLEEDLLRKEDERRRSWASEGIAKFGDIFRSEREDVKELAYKIIHNLVKYLNAAAGTIYLTDQEIVEKQEYEMAATYAWDRRKYMEKRIVSGEGLVGTCALEKETIFLTEIPEDYFDISSGLIDMKPVCLLLVPLKIEKEIFGVIELVSVKVFNEFEVRFVEQLSEITATTLAAVRINEQTSRLLEQSRKQTEEMQKQEERMRMNMEALQKAQDESQRKESEITGILNAVNSSSLVAEFTLNGRFSYINEKLLTLFESPAELIIGKHHSDFAVTDKYSDEYKQFWKDLREGTVITKTEKLRLFSGAEIWLEETFSAVMDNEGKPVKIINISHDISNTKKQQEELTFQANEIVRRSKEMKSLSKAVDDSIIYSEMSIEGIITSVNSNFLEITGYSKKELLGKNNRLFLKDIEKEQFEKIFAEVMKDKIYTGVIRRTKPTGEEVWLMATFSPVKDEHDKLYKIYFLAQDITEKKLKYQLLDEANKEIERLRDHINKLETI